MSTRLEKVKAALPEGIDGIFVTNDCNREWLSGFHFSDGFLLVTKEKSYLLTDSRYIEAATAEADPGLEEFGTDPAVSSGGTGDFIDIGFRLFAQSGNGVYGGDPLCQQCVGDQFGQFA